MFENQQLSNADAVPSFLAHRRLALHAARAGTLHQALDLRDGDAVVVAQNRVLQAGCRHSKKPEHLPLVVFGLEDAVSGNFAPLAEAKEGAVSIFMKEIPSAETITVPALILQ